MSERELPYAPKNFTVCPVCKGKFVKGYGWSLNLQDGSVSHECCSLKCLDAGYGAGNAKTR